MLTIQEVRDTLPDKGKNLSDEQVTKLRNDMEAFANLAFDMWLEEKRKNKKI